MTPIFATLTILAAAVLPPPPAPAPEPPKPPVVAAPALDPAVAEVKARVDAMMDSYKGKTLLELARRLGPSETTRAANDGQVQYWHSRTGGGTVCGMSPATGAFNCNRTWGKECMLAVAADAKSKITAWKLTGEVDACKLFLAPPPAPPPA